MKKYGTNNYRAFLSLASDAESLDNLSDALNGVGFEGTQYDGVSFEGVVNQEYEVIRPGNSVIVLIVSMVIKFSLQTEKIFSHR